MASRTLVTQKPSGKVTANRTSKVLASSRPALTRDSATPAAGSLYFNFRDILVFSPDEDRRSRRGGMPGSLPWPIQAKLEIGAVDEPLERDADQVADRVLRMPDPTRTAAVSGGGMLRRQCQSCAEEGKEQDEKEK